MNENEKKGIGLEFIQQLRSKCKDIESFKTTLKEFASESSENRAAVGMGLLAIGADKSEAASYRNVMLTQLALFVRSCGLRNNKNVQEQLNYVIDDWIATLPNQQIPSGALLALARVNRNAALEKCDHVIKHYGESEAGRHVRKLREDFERLNPLEV